MRFLCLTTLKIIFFPIIFIWKVLEAIYHCVFLSACDEDDENEYEYEDDEYEEGEAYMCNKATIIDEIKQTFEDVEIGTIFTTSEIKAMVSKKFGRNEGSIIPSDCCYNMTNKGIIGTSFEHFNIFMQIGWGKYIYVGEDYSLDECEAIIAREAVPEKQKPDSHRTSREISAGLRYKILKRDNFKCCACGASPAKDPSVELHIDHIVPWSKGGETEMENLQVLCSKCNIGKSNSL